MLRLWFAFICAVLLPQWLGATELRNHPSPYLQLHAEDPVKWRVLDESTLAFAQKTNKPIFLTLGYFSCYWCHVMQRESFQNKAIAEQINQSFIPVVVDRELQPSIDATLIEFAEQFHGRAGWPLNVFLTPEGHPIYATVYLPADAFTSVLIQISAKWRDERPRLETIAKQITQLFKSQPRIRAITSSDVADIKQLKEKLIEDSLINGDVLSGGFGSQSKFPSVPQLQVLLQLYEDKPRKDLADFLKLTLSQMATQGLRDHVAGGFFRYTIDPQWQTPHFEKMLYDNAQLAGLYLDASRVMQREDYLRVALDTLDFVHGRMQHPNGEYVSSFSAIDGNDVEGGYYLWSKDVLRRQLNKDEFQIIEEMWGLEQPPTLEEGYHAVIHFNVAAIAKKLSRNKDAILRDYETAVKKLLSYRQEKRLLPTDTKTLAAWNGLLLQSYAKAARLTRDLKWQRRGEELRDTLLMNHWRGTKLYRMGYQLHPQEGNLEDYAYLANGLVTWADVSQKEGDWQVASDIIHSAWKRFFVTDQGWRLSNQLLLPLMRRETAMADGPMPAPNAVLIQATQKLLNVRNDKPLHDKLKAALDLLPASLKESRVFWYASHLVLMK